MACSAGSSLLGFWNRSLGVLGALGSIFTFLGTVTIIPFLPNAWAAEAGGFPVMNLPVAFLMKDILFLAASLYLLKQDLTGASIELAQNRASKVNRSIQLKIQTDGETCCDPMDSCLVTTCLEKLT
jgi:hypothetical protein